MTLLETAFNIAFLLFWLRIWGGQQRETFFNPYLAPLDRASGALLRFLRPISLRASNRTLAAGALLFALVFRGFAFYAARHNHAPWTLQFGLLTGTAEATGLIGYLAMSFLSFAFFLFKIWALAMLYILARSSKSTDRTSGTLNYLAKPFSSWKKEWQFPILVLVGVSLCAGLDVVSWTGPRMRAASLVPFYAICTLAEWVNVLNLAAALLMVFIIGSWIAMFSRSSYLMFACREWTDFLLGPLSNYPMIMGSLDLTPLIFFFVVHSFLHPVLISFLISLSERLP